VPAHYLNSPLGAYSRRAAVAEGLVARPARRGQLVHFSVPDDRVSRAAAEARSNSGGGGEAAAPTSGVPGQNQAPRNRSEAEIPRSRRDWASGCVSPTGARRDRPSGRPDNAKGGKRGQRSGIGAIPYREEGAASLECSPPARLRRVAGEADGSDESLLSEETSAENAWPWSKTADGGRGHGAM